MLIMLITIIKYAVCFITKSPGVFGPPERNSWSSWSPSLGGFPPGALCTSQCPRSRARGARSIPRGSGTGQQLLLQELSSSAPWAGCPGLQGAPDVTADVAGSVFSTVETTNTPQCPGQHGGSCTRLWKSEQGERQKERAPIHAL